MTPIVKGNQLTGVDNAPIALGSVAWFRWLGDHRVFRFVSRGGSFTARKELRAGRWYWYAYRRQQGQLHNLYLGKTEELTTNHLVNSATILSNITATREPASTDPQSPTVLTAKVTPPLMHAEVLDRPRLTAMLREYATQRQFFLITGPAGSGKSTLVNSWLAVSGHPYTWLTLDTSDNEPAHFWHYMVASLQAIQPELALHTITQRSALNTTPVATTLPSFINALACLPTNTTLVLDDYHHINNQVIHDSLDYLLEYLPQQLRLVIISRQEPTVSIARLRARGKVAELTFAQLCFTPGEIQQWSNGMADQPLSTEQVGILHTRTQGWIALLRLVLLAQQQMPEQASSHTFIPEDHPYIFDYLTSEVLAAQPQQVQEFLMQTAILECFNSELCHAVTQQHNACHIVMQLQREHIFLEPLDGGHQWFRYHSLFSSFLRQQLEQRQPELITTLHQRAARWYMQQQMPDEAITHACAAKQFALAAQLVEIHGHDLLMQQAVVVLQSWLARFPGSILTERPQLCLFSAWVQLHLAPRWDEIERTLLQAETAMQTQANRSPELQSEIIAIRARIAMYQGDNRRSLKLLQQAYTGLNKDNLYQRGEVALSLGSTYASQGILDKAEASLRESIRLSSNCHNLRTTLLAVRTLANLYVEQGKLLQAWQLYHKGLRISNDNSVAALPPLGFMYVGLGEICYEWNDLSRAREYLQRGIALGQRGGDIKIWLLGYAGLMQTLLAQGETAQTWSLFAEAEKLVKQTGFPRGQLLLEQLQVRLHYLQRDTAFMQQWSANCDLPLDANEIDARYEEDYQLLARTLLLQHQPAAAQAIIQRLCHQIEASQQQGILINLLISSALAYAVEGKISQALETLSNSLKLAEPANYQRTFIDAGPGLLPLLENLCAKPQIYSGYTTGYLEKVFNSSARFHSYKNVDSRYSAAGEALSRRELDILHLLAEGLSNQAIAGRLIIGQNTVKTHLKNIYSKLDAHSRTQALAVARSRRLL
ncbi:LuxR C-terminal-related transcriptional regulator [Dictyobacter aurantiacus]|uniref:HTH-type transcriptional regulator MalT n=1 Tax=Dictyobacter aurantiacus TaxID=1936993 RepID=A0A401ZSJ6_9CHLR|nr:LuxR C-terminal-related transcriptional regulator [Dictyobacter aurantiacus]GCE09754.1 HTH-type transcriptional regulator MalT [Dictyobacter aurantiacus]